MPRRFVRWPRDNESLLGLSHQRSGRVQRSDVASGRLRLFCRDYEFRKRRVRHGLDVHGLAEAMSALTIASLVIGAAALGASMWAYLLLREDGEPDELPF